VTIARLLERSVGRIDAKAGRDVEVMTTAGEATAGVSPDSSFPL
jgi:hypothetical protein